MNTKYRVALLATGIVSLLAFSIPNLADADSRSRQRDLDRRAARAQESSRAELQRDRAELQRDYAELERDRADLRRLYRSGASRSEIDRKKAEIRRGLNEVAQGRREVQRRHGTATRELGPVWFRLGQR